MFQRPLCPSVGAILRPQAQARIFHASARHCADNGSDSNNNPSAAPSAPKSSEPLDTRRTRMRAAAAQVANLRSAQAGTQIEGTPNRPLIRRVALPGSAPEGARSTQPGPPGKMVRAPTTLRITRTPTGPSGPRPSFPRAPRGAGLDGRPDGPNLRGRRPGSGPGGPRKREPRAKAAGGQEEEGEVKVEDTLSDGMVQQLLRLQRKMWDRTEYVPMYAPGSQAALDLITEGKKLFAGEVKKVKKPGRLERRIGVVGMHGA